MIFLRIASILITSIGAIFAVFGNTYRNRRLTKTGKLALSIIVLGLLISSIIEFNNYINKQTNEYWEFYKGSQIEYIYLQFFFYKPTKIFDFWEYTKKFEFVFSDNTNLWNDESARFLRISTVSEIYNPKDLRTSLVLASFDNKGKLISYGDKCNFCEYIKNPGFKSNVFRFEPKKQWDSEYLETNCIKVRIPFSKVGLSDEVKTFEEFVKKILLTIYIPNNINWSDVGYFDLGFSKFSIDLTKLDYYEEKFLQPTGRKVSEFGGIELREILKERVRRYEKIVFRRKYDPFF